MLRAVFMSFVLFALAAGLPQSSQAQERPSAILVLDASGSMWGQIDGVNKIVIAREVVTDLLGSLPDEQALGLVTYGHRRKGDCSDIEVMYQPGTDRDAIAKAVNSLNPKGKTPLSAAVIQAAEALRHTEEAATVILVSDGIETCNYDPCEVGRQLEETGVNFTAHVIGFDVADPAARAQLQCLADETGGTFRTADDADELADALGEVAAAPVPDPEPILWPTKFQALEGEGGPLITQGLVWTIRAGDEVLAEGSAEAGPSFQLTEGLSGTATVIRLIDEEVVTARFTVQPTGNIITVIMPEYAPPAGVETVASAPAGSLVEVTFFGPRAGGDYLSSAREGKEDGYYDEYTNVDQDPGESGKLMLRLPPVPGPAEIRYVMGDGAKTLARTTIEVTPLEIALPVPEAAAVGFVESIAWEGPDYDRDYITVSKPDDRDAGYETYEYTEKGAPMALPMPSEPGTYELRYVLGASRHVAARSAPFEVAETAVFVRGPQTAVAGSTVPVEWSGPNAKNDYIAVAAVDADGGKQETYAYTKDGSPLDVVMPPEAGDYELRYILNQDRQVLARQKITLTEPTASLSAASNAVQGAQIEVTWEGPDYHSDYIGIGELGTPNHVTYTYTAQGSPLRIEAPGAPGTYEIRYYMNQGKRVLATAPLNVEAAEVNLSAPDSVAAGGPFYVTYSGPDTHNDWVDISGDAGDVGTLVDYAYVQNADSEGTLTLTAPTEPGVYFIRYILNGAPDAVLAAKAIMVTEVAASISGTLGADGIAVTVEGPRYKRDYVAIAEPGMPVATYLDYSYMRDGEPVVLPLPETPGTYELRYILEGNVDRILARSPITVE